VRLGARGRGACPWVLWPVRVTLLRTLVTADPGTLAADLHVVLPPVDVARISNGLTRLSESSGTR
jgi:hypothetical protein